MKTWFVFNGCDEKPYEIMATDAAETPTGALVLGERQEEGMFFATAIFARECWTRCYQMPVPVQEVQG